MLFEICTSLIVPLVNALDFLERLRHVGRRDEQEAHVRNCLCHLSEELRPVNQVGIREQENRVREFPEFSVIMGSYVVEIAEGIVFAVLICVACGVAQRERECDESIDVVCVLRCRECSTESRKRRFDCVVTSMET